MPKRKTRSRTIDVDTDAHAVVVGGTVVRPGERKRIELPAARLPTQTSMFLPIEVINGRRPGARVWLSAAIHGDELNGLEIIHRIMQKVKPAKLQGEIIAAPIVNVFGFIQQTRYLPDRRDLNRSFPGSPNGSLTGRLAHLFMDQVVGRCTHGIDLHTASNHRTNLPQVRADLNDTETRRIAEAFAAPIMIHGEAPRGSLRGAVAQRGVPIIVYEAGEPQRFNSEAIDLGVKGVLRVLSELGMWGKRPAQRLRSMETFSTRWVRARRSGILRLNTGLGKWVSKGQVIGAIGDAFGDQRGAVTSTDDGLVIGHTNNPSVNQGDAIVHLARDVVTHHAT